MSRKSRGINAERDLIHKFWSVGWAALRAAGSGSQQYPAPDVLASNNVRKVAIECKLTTSTRQYFSKKEVRELQYFAEKFGAEPWLAVKFFRQEWRFLPVEDAEETGASFVISLERAQNHGFTFEEFVAP